MATITLYANKVNQMPGLLKDAQKSVVDYKSELEALRKNTIKINKRVCDLDDVINGIRSSTLIQEEKAAALDALGQRCEWFIGETAQTDQSVADAVRKRKEDFYEEYPYLKPECEKNDWERLCGNLQTAGEWCREHWKLIETIVLVVCAVVLLCSGVGAVLAGMCLGTIFGAVIGGVSGGLEGLSRGRPFMEGFEEGANTGAKKGALLGTFFAVLGAAGGVLGLGIGSATKLGVVIKATAAVTRALSIGMGSFDLLALLDMAIDNAHNPVADANRKLHSYKLYNIFQFMVAATAVFTGGMAATMPHGESGSNAQGVGNPVAVEGRGNTGRTVPNTLNEQMAMNQVQSNPLEGATKVPLEMTDFRWPASEGWVKMQSVVQNADGIKTTIHYVYNEITGAFDDFKFK